MTIKTLPAFYGDCILVSWIHEGKKRNMLVDGGPAATYPVCIRLLLAALKEQEQVIDLLIVTHYDKDHIDGIIQWYQDEDADSSIIQNVWFNNRNPPCGRDWLLKRTTGFCEPSLLRRSEEDLNQHKNS